MRSLLGGTAVVLTLAIGTWAGAEPLRVSSPNESRQTFSPRVKITLNDKDLRMENAFIYAFPMVMNYGTLYAFAIDKESPEYKGPFNVLHNTANVFTPKDTAVVTPNSDTPYSFVTCDLRAEPIVISVPEIESSRYYSVQLIDLYTCNFGYLGSRTTGNMAGNYLLAGPLWKGDTPPGIAKVFRSETELAMLIIRTQLFGPSDLDDVRAIQAKYRVQPLSAFLQQPAPPAPPPVNWPKIDKQLAEENPWEYLNLLLTFCPAVGTAAVEQPLREQFTTIGIVPGQPFPFDQLPVAKRAQLLGAQADGQMKIKNEVAKLGERINGWQVGTWTCDRAGYHGDWTRRAAVAMAGIYANDAAEAMYPMLVTDSEGNRPDCSKNRYTLTFAAGQLPPVNAFWSVTMYDAKTQLLVANPIDRYLINSPMLPQLKKDADGSLTLFLQKDSPGKERESNWLPAPDGPIYLVMRLYWPKPEALDGKWRPPAVVRVK